MHSFKPTAIPESIEQPRSGEESSLPLPTSSTTREGMSVSFEDFSIELSQTIPTQ